LYVTPNRRTIENVRKTTIPITVLVLALLVAAGAQATAPRVTQGEAQAIFEAFDNGGWAVRLHAGSLEGAPADFLPDSLARISPNPPWDGRHFCSLDWHVITLAIFDGNAAGESRTNQEIREFLSQIDVIFTLDGAPLDTMRTAIKRFLNPERFGLVDGYWFAEGQVMAPTDLSVGQHTLQATVLVPGEEPDVSDPITFFIDAPGTGACL
jgi:hypothetical protein